MYVQCNDIVFVCLKLIFRILCSCSLVYLGLVDEPEEEVEVEEYSSESESSEESSIGDMDYGNDDEDQISDVENNAEEEAGVEILERLFDVKVNLEKIGCSRFYDAIVAEGYVDEVSDSI